MDKTRSKRAKKMYSAFAISGEIAAEESTGSGAGA